jgi:hypothetical protein
VAAGVPIWRTDISDQPYIRQLGTAFHKDDVLRLDVAMGESLPMKKVQCFRQWDYNSQALANREPHPWRTSAHGRQIARFVRDRILFPIGHERIPQFHDIIETSGAFQLVNKVDMQQPGMAT